MPSPVDTAWLVLKTDLRFGEHDPDDPNPMHLDLRRRNFGHDIVADQGREADFADEFISAAQHHNELHSQYLDDDDYMFYDGSETSPQELREQAMSELDEKDRLAAARIIDHIKDKDVGNAMFLAHTGGRGFNVPENEMDALVAQAQQEAAAGQEGVPMFAREGFYGPQPFRQPEFFDRALPLGPNTELKSYNVDLPQTVMASPHEKAWTILKFGYPSVEGANYPMREKPEEGKKDKLAEALARARKQKPDPPIEFAPKLPKPPKMPEDPYQMQLPPEFVGDATVGGDFRNADFSRLKL